MNFPKMRGGSKAVRNFSENLSILVMQGFPRKYNSRMILRPKDTPENSMFLPSNMKFSYMRELLFSQLWEKTNILVSTRIAFLRRELLLGKSTKNSLNLLQTRITQRKVILVCIVRESLILVCFLGENYIKPRRELSFSLLENDNSRLNIVILPLIRGENHVIRGTITVSSREEKGPSMGEGYLSKILCGKNLKN